MDGEVKPASEENLARTAERSQSGEAFVRKVSRFLVKNAESEDDVQLSLSDDALENHRKSALSDSDGSFHSVATENLNESTLLDEQRISPNSANRTVRFEQRFLHEDSDNTHYTHGRTWNNLKTIEHPPIMDFYRNTLNEEQQRPAARPTMAQLIHGAESTTNYETIEKFKVHNDKLVAVDLKTPQIEKGPGPQSAARVKFGWVQGVFVRCLLNIFGVMLYLRISWVAGQAGIGLGSVIVLLASLVTTITAISTCAICTNGEVKGGGAYFLISRTLGPEFGGAIGLIFSVANAVGGAMYIVGFSETVRDLLKEFNLSPIDGDLWDVRVIGAVTCVALMAIVFIGTEFESKMQIGLLAILLGSLVNYVIGSVLPPNDEMQKRGVTGYSWNTLIENFMPNFRDEDFFSVFAVYFPAATGIMAGANISGDLADPQRSIPLGTLLAIAVTTVTYLAAVVATGSTCVREANGINLPVWNSSAFVPPDCAQNSSCPYGLMNYFQVMEMESLWGPLITAGIFAATLSSALASLVSAPKVFQAVCKDKLYPKIGFFAKAYGKNEEPRRAYLLAFIICIAMIGIGDLNAIAPIISNFFLASYALINYACFDQSFADSPGFRPAFKYYNMWVSLGGALLCLLVMFIISWATALISFVCFGVLFFYIHYRKPDVNWGSSTQAHSYRNALNGMIKLSQTEDHVKNFRPQLLVLTGNPASRPSLVDFAKSITKGNSLMVCGNVIPYHPSHRVCAVMRKLDRKVNVWLHKRKVRAFYASTANQSLRAGAQNLLQACGLGRLRPNITLIGFKNNWNQGTTMIENINDVNEYFSIIQDAFDMDIGVAVFRNGDSKGFDLSQSVQLLNIDETNKVEDAQDYVEENRGDTPLMDDDIERESLNVDQECADEDVEDNEDDEDQGEADQMLLTESIYHYRTKKITKGVIDVWWLYDDGGLTLLLPYLLSQPKSYLENACLRIFTIPTSSRTAAVEHIGMIRLLSKFRITVSSVKQINDITKPPGAEVTNLWTNMISPWIVPDDDPVPGMTTERELNAHKVKTNRHLRIRELLEENSSEASLIVLSLPVPRKDFVSASLYMSWLDVMSSGLPPTLLVRGNQTPVLTMYS